jgi:hypothetical protein
MNMPGYTDNLTRKMVIEPKESEKRKQLDMSQQQGMDKNLHL